MEKKDDRAGLIHPVASPTEDTLPRPIKWMEPDGSVVDSWASKTLSVSALLEMLNRVRPENRNLPLHFRVRGNSEVAESYPLCLATRAQIGEDAVNGEKAVFMDAKREHVALLFVFPEATIDYSLAGGNQGAEHDPVTTSVGAANQNNSSEDR